MAFPLLVLLVAAVVILGVLQYWLLLALGSAAYLGFSGWKRWQQPGLRGRGNRRPRPARARRR